MTDQARKDEPDLPPAGGQGWPRPVAGGGPRLGSKVVSFALPGLEGGSSSDPSGSSSNPMDWTASLQLVEEAGEALRISEERVLEVEAQIQEVMQQANSEIRRLTGVVAAGEQKLAKTEERLRLAELRATDAEAWLVRLNHAVFTAFPSLQDRRTEDGDDGQAPRTTNAVTA